MNPLTATGLPVCLTAEIRDIEQRAYSTLTEGELMERAGLAAAELAREIVAGSRKRILIFAGPGNNGGDAFVVARHLKQSWHNVMVVFAADIERLSSEARTNFDRWHTMGGEIVASPPSPKSESGLIVDGLFGIGLQREPSGQYAEWIQYINGQSAAVLALDVPSGLDADSGRLLGCAVRATHTATFIALKPGLLTLDGPDHSGELHVYDLSVDVEALAPARGRVIGRDTAIGCLPPRKLNSHKGTFGSVGVLGGAPGMSGAALLAARAALKLGAGRVYAGFVDSDANLLDALQPELMLRQATDILEMDELACLVLGPGMSRSDQAHGFVERALALPIPLVIDADGLNIIGADQRLQQLCSKRSTATLLTPHPAEAARLRQTTTKEVQHDRVAAGTALAAQYRAVVALKGAGTVVAEPEGGYYINRSGNPGLASAGMGDVLSGILAALIAQGADPPVAMRAGVYLHGLAADRLATQHGGPIGMTASEVTDAARDVLNEAIYSKRTV